MSNINQVITLVKNAGTDVTKAQLVEQIMQALNVTKSNAQVYLYNANKKLGNPVQTPTKKPGAVLEAFVNDQLNRKRKTKAKPVKPSKTSEEVAAIKAKNLETIKAVAKDRKKFDEAELQAKREEMQAEINTFMDDADAYIATLTAPSRKFMVGAE